MIGALGKLISKGRDSISGKVDRQPKEWYWLREMGLCWFSHDGILTASLWFVNE